jgi:hypothetical protein
VTRNIWLSATALVLCLFGAATFVALRQGPALSGTIVDARSGRVAAGVALTYDGRILRRFRSKDFSFAGRVSGLAVLKADAPGYEPMTIDLPPGKDGLVVAMKPVAIPGLWGVVVFPKQAGTTLEMSLQLLDANGRALSEFPGVDLDARLVIASAEGAPVGFIDLAPRVDFAAPEIAIALKAEMPAIAAAARPNGAFFAISVKAGDKVVSSRPFSLPPDAKPEGAAP